MTVPTTQVPGTALPMPRPEGAGMTHRGRVRERNEDSILTDPGGTLWAVADGMGGYDLGDVASDMVIDALATLSDDGDPVADLTDRLIRANAAVLARAREAGGGPMGATVVACMIRRAVAHLVWAGDSRAYLMRSGHLRLLTRDHTVVQDLVEAGALNPDEAGRHPESHVVTRAVGMGADFEVDSVSVPIVPGDRLLLCSDGLHGCLSESRIATALAGPVAPGEVCKGLVADALEAGAPDNVSVIVVDLKEG
ncbi:serine/threonine protein phosphatase PrpC [Rhodovulum iodosum]|uniref:Serine/threonine protein phosphatase PrpC n=1 Tax=Rhodovulum iodosum TaxID=68291 RepID=A0ABV3XUW0_9RHOB|nr:protein phosphatase 2C domain-containing protein [Rhodovulum robiginosum]RSK41015.1 serine/threonine-protein phosphatase [Rhodovulum robiginosum]